MTVRYDKLVKSNIRLHNIQSTLQPNVLRKLIFLSGKKKAIV